MHNWRGGTRDDGVVLNLDVLSLPKFAFEDITVESRGCLVRLPVGPVETGGADPTKKKSTCRFPCQQQWQLSNERTDKSYTHPYVPE